MRTEVRAAARDGFYLLTCGCNFDVALGWACGRHGIALGSAAFYDVRLAMALFIYEW